VLIARDLEHVEQIPPGPAPSARTAWREHP